MIPSRYADEERILEFDWRKGNASQQIHSKVKVSSANFSWWLLPCKKTQISIDFWQWYWSSKTFMTWLKKRHTWDNLTKSDCLRCYLLLGLTPGIKNQDINQFYPEIMVIKESCNLIGPEAQLATPTKQMTTHNQKWKSQLLNSLGDYLRAKNLRYQLILSSHFDDQRILHSY